MKRKRELLRPKWKLKKEILRRKREKLLKKLRKIDLWYQKITHKLIWIDSILNLMTKIKIL
jgi:hypothetical protein